MKKVIRKVTGTRRVPELALANYAGLDLNILAACLRRAVRQAFTVPDAANQLKQITDVNDFRNTYFAHHEKPLMDRGLPQRT